MATWIDSLRGGSGRLEVTRADGSSAWMEGNVVEIETRDDGRWVSPPVQMVRVTLVMNEQHATSAPQEPVSRELSRTEVFAWIGAQIGGAASPTVAAADLGAELLSAVQAARDATTTAGGVGPDPEEQLNLILGDDGGPHLHIGQIRGQIVQSQDPMRRTVTINEGGMTIEVAAEALTRFGGAISATSATFRNLSADLYADLSASVEEIRAPDNSTKKVYPTSKVGFPKRGRKK